MKLRQFQTGDTDTIIALFDAVFGESEGAEQGRMVSGLVDNLIRTTAPENLDGYLAVSEDAVVGAIFLSRLWLADERSAWILSPVAVATASQGRGAGQRLIRHGLMQLQERGIDLVLTYGDPAFYTKLGFQPISESVIKAPLELSYPHGWLAQSLTGLPILPAEGAVRCVDALNDQKYW